MKCVSPGSELTACRANADGAMADHDGWVLQAMVADDVTDSQAAGGCTADDNYVAGPKERSRR